MDTAPDAPRPAAGCSGKPPPPIQYPFKFSTLAEGDFDPTLRHTIEWLIDSDDDFIVYIDEQNYVEWNMNDNDMLGADTGQALNRIAQLESFDTDELSSEKRAVYARMIAEAVARLFQKDVKSADAVLTLAEEWIKARTTEIARTWYLTGAGLASLVCAVVVVWLVFFGGRPQGVDPVGSAIHMILLGSFVGGLGAWLSVLQRSRTVSLDITAGRRMHQMEGIFRIMVGVLGAFIVVIAIRADLLGKFNHLSAIVLMCVAAGVSERMVPSLIQQIESRASGKT